MQWCTPHSKHWVGMGCMGAMQVCVSGWTPAMAGLVVGRLQWGELRWFTVIGVGAPPWRPLLVWWPAMACVGLVARHGGR